MNTNRLPISLCTCDHCMSLRIAKKEGVTTSTGIQGVYDNLEEGPYKERVAKVIKKNDHIWPKFKTIRDHADEVERGRELDKKYGPIPEPDKTGGFGVWNTNDAGEDQMLINEESRAHLDKIVNGEKRDNPHVVGVWEVPPTPKHDPVSNPDHYTWHPSGVEQIDISEHMSYNLGTAIKYIWRCNHKGNVIEDLNKARFLIEREIKRMQEMSS